MALAEQRDPYAAAWLVADVAPLLAAAGYDTVWSLVEHYAARVEAERAAYLAYKASFEEAN